MKVLKTYPLQSSPLYRVRTKKVLARCLKCTPRDLTRFRNDDGYRCFEDNGREIQYPTEELFSIHKRIKVLLSRIEVPPYLYSGVRGLSYIENADFHRESHYFVSMDIKSFYKSTRQEYVFRFFYYDLEMERDVAYIFSQLCCCNESIPTGSPSSQLLAYFSYWKTFNKISELANSRGYRFSLYVDDMVFSHSAPLVRSFHVQVETELRNVKLSLKRSKLKYSRPHKATEITGCIISNGRLSIPHRRMKSAIDSMREAETNQSETNIRRVLGKIDSMRSIDKAAFHYTRLQYLRKLKTMQSEPKL